MRTAHSPRNNAATCIACGEPWLGTGLQCPACLAGKAKTAAKSPPAGPAAATLPPKSEAEIRMELRRWCELKGAVVVIDTEQGYRPDRCKHCGESTDRGTTRIVRGFPDLIVLWPAPRSTWWIEAKSATGRQTDHQRQFQAWCEAAGEVYVLARSVDDLEELGLSGVYER